MCTKYSYFVGRNKDPIRIPWSFVHIVHPLPSLPTMLTGHANILIAQKKAFLDNHLLPLLPLDSWRYHTSTVLLYRLLNSYSISRLLAEGNNTHVTIKQFFVWSACASPVWLHWPTYSSAPWCQCQRGGNNHAPHLFGPTDPDSLLNTLSPSF